MENKHVRVKITEDEYFDIIMNGDSLICGMHKVEGTDDYFDFEPSSQEYAWLCYLRAPTIDLSEKEK